MKFRFWLSITVVTVIIVGVIVAPHLVSAAGYCPGGTCGRGQE